MFPQINYVVNEKGAPIFVQMSVTEWEAFVTDYKHLKSLAVFKERFKTVFTEIREIQRGEKLGTTLTEFLNEL